MTRVNGCINNRIVVLIGAGSQSTYALQSALAMGARKVILVNRGAERLERVMRDFSDERVVGLPWTDNVRDAVLAECRPFNEPHFIMVNASAEAAYRLAVDLMGYATVLDAHAGVKGASGKPVISHEVDLNNDVHYKLQCYQATHGSTMHGIGLAGDMINRRQLPLLGRMTGEDEIFAPSQMINAIEQASGSSSLKVIIDWERE
jgi:threonine dehydrogenase-like Zn-dependent dehydrogenase